MKKFLSLALVLVMMMSLSLTAFAAETTTTGDNITIDVDAKYSDEAGALEVVSVDVEWGVMEFTYNIGGTKIWDPANHEYKSGDTTASWTASGNTVTVTNHSNIPIKAELSYESFRGEISGSFGEDATLYLATAEGTSRDKAPSDTAELTLSGVMYPEYSNFTTVGTITVKIGKL